MHLNNTDDVHERDEIKLLQRGRMTSSMQAWYLIWGYQNYPATQPSVMLIKAKLPYMVQDLAISKKLCDLAVYFARPRDAADFAQLTYTAFYQKYKYRPRRLQRNVQTCYEIEMHGKPLYIYPNDERHIVRMQSVPFVAGELYWLRLLLYKYPAYSFEELRTVPASGHVCITFQEAARQRNLIEDEAVAREIFEECIITSTPHELRVLFTNMTLQGFPTGHIYNSMDLQGAMYQDYFDRTRGNIALSTNKLLLELSRLFKLQGSVNLSDYGLPEPQSQSTELEIERLTYDVAQQAQLAASLLAANPLTGEMAALFHDIEAALHRGGEEPFIAILQGIAGAGKSTFVKYIMAYVRSLGFIAKGCASTGLAASVYEDFSTAHSLFAIPVLEDEEDFDQEGDLQCRLHLKKYEERQELLNEMKFCAWDEISSQHMRDVRAVMAALKGFAGKVLLFVGDGLQITPVVQGGSKAAICASSIYCSELMQSARYYQFTKILRLQNADGNSCQANYSRMLRGISLNAAPQWPEPPFHIACDEQRVDGIARLYIPHLRPLFSAADVVLFCYPGGFNTNIMHHSCILAATNAQVDFWNAEVQKLNHQLTWTLLSKDSVDGCDDPRGYLARMVTEDVMNRYDDPSTSPPHKLNLKLHDICILMRAVSKCDMLATNTRVRVTGISNQVVRVTTLDEAHPRSANLPRFVFKLKLPYGKSFHICRRQFPLRLAYSLTINRSQGQTIERVGVDLTRPCFMHGHLNVALSRIRDSNNIAVYIKEEDYDAANKMFITTNVVYPEIVAAISK